MTKRSAERRVRQETGWLAGGPLLHVATIRHTTDTFLFISHTMNILLFKFHCNIFIGVRIIKEMLGSVASGTLCSILHSTAAVCPPVTVQHIITFLVCKSGAPYCCNLLSQHFMYIAGVIDIISKYAINNKVVDILVLNNLVRCRWCTQRHLLLSKCHMVLQYTHKCNQ